MPAARFSIFTYLERRLRFHFLQGLIHALREVDEKVQQLTREYEAQGEESTAQAYLIELREDFDRDRGSQLAVGYHLVQRVRQRHP